jgi:hypothetical protein
MVLVGKTECRDWKTVTEVCGRQSQLCVDHRNTESQRNTVRRRSGQIETDEGRRVRCSIRS